MSMPSSCDGGRSSRSRCRGRVAGAPSPAVRDRTMRCELVVPRPALRGSPHNPPLSHELSHRGTRHPAWLLGCYAGTAPGKFATEPLTSPALPSHPSRQSPSRFGSGCAAAWLRGARVGARPVNPTQGGSRWLVSPRWRCAPAGRAAHAHRWRSADPLPPRRCWPRG